MKLKLLNAFLVTSLCFCLPAIVYAEKQSQKKFEKWSAEYDSYFRKYAKRYFGPNFDWQWFKAQGIAESNLAPKVKSHAGAQGIMQILPATFKEIKQANPYFLSITEPRWNIAAGIYYDRMLYKKWLSKITATDRIYLTLASYNAGYGRILKAQKRAGKKGHRTDRWQFVSPHVPGETRNYVKRIDKLMRFN